MSEDYLQQQMEQLRGACYWFRRNKRMKILPSIAFLALLDFSDFGGDVKNDEMKRR